MLNSIALGDVVAAAPVVRHMVEKYYTSPATYYVVAKPQFRPLFPFVPDESFRNYDQKDNFWNLPAGIIMGCIGKNKEPGVTRLTPKHMHLGQFASIMLADRILPFSELNYVPLEPVDIQKFATDFSSAVILVTSYRDKTRMIYPEEILKISEWLLSRKILPVFVGKTDFADTERESNLAKSSLTDAIAECGLDLRNKTTIPELASIMQASLAVVGVDSGPIHLAGTTTTPIVCGYTSVSPEHRVPIRRTGQTIAIAPEIECIGCESRWRSNTWNYEQCYFGHTNCSRVMTADRFINALESIL